MADLSKQLHPGFVDKLLIWVAWIAGGALFFSFGWGAMAPTDPQGAVSLLARNGSVGMFLFALVLAGVISAVGTLLAGKHLPDAGVFAASVGMVAVSVRGDTSAYFLLERADSGGIGNLGLSFALETVVWFVVVAISILICHVLVAKLPGSVAGNGRHYLTQLPAGADLVRRDLPKTPNARVSPTSKMAGLLHLVLVAAIGFASFRVFSSGLNVRSIEHGQACFVVAASIGVGCYFAHRIAPVSSAIWAIGGALVVAVVGYASASFVGGEGSLPAGVPVDPFLRVLPIQFAAMGTATAVAMCWYMCDPEYTAALENGPVVAGGRAITQAMRK